MQDYGCILTNYEEKLRPIFYIKTKLWFKILNLNEKKIDKLYEILIENDEETYVLNINDMGLPATPIQKNILQELINNSYDIKNLNIENICQKYNLTKEYLENLVIFLNKEVKKMTIDLILYDIKNTPKKNQDISSNSSNSSYDSNDKN